MGVIWIKCPATGRKAPTGIETEAKQIVQLPAQLSNARCPFCGMRHNWVSDDAWVVGPSRATESLRAAG